MCHAFGVIPIRPSALVSDEELEAITADSLRALEALGGELCSADTWPDDSRQVFLLVATGGTERTVLDLWFRRPDPSPDDALFLIAHPGNNSLPAALEVLARLQQDGARGRIFYLEGADDEVGLREISEAAHDEAVRRALREARIGRVGEASDWLVASMPDASTVKEVWGPTVVPIEIDEVVTVLETFSDDELEPHERSLVAGAEKVLEPTASDVQNVARIYLALKKVVTENDLDALTVRCFDFVQHQKTTGCFALAQLTDEGTIAGCEGDLVSTIGLLWARELLDVTPWMANPAQLDADRNSLWLAHCTVPRTLVESYRLRSHFESGLGVGIQGSLPTGPVTLLRIGGKGLDKLWLAEGEILRSGDAADLCRTQVELGLTKGGAVADLLRAPLGNHLVMVRGHHLERLQSWWDHVVGDAFRSGSG